MSLNLRSRTAHLVAEQNKGSLVGAHTTWKVSAAFPFSTQTRMDEDSVDTIMWAQSGPRQSIKLLTQNY